MTLATIFKFMAVFVPPAMRKPHLFLSHSSKDKDFVRKLANDLTACEVDVWLDEWEIEPGDSIYKAINNAISSSQFVGLFLSNSFIESKWASEEVEAAFSKQIDLNSKVILPILIENVEIPQLLRGKLNISFVDDYDYYSSLTKLVAIIHNIEWKIIINALNEKKPTKLNEVIELLSFCGLNPYYIVPEQVFNEFSQLETVTVEGNRIHFHELHYDVENENLSEVARVYIQKIYSIVFRDGRFEN